MCMLLKALRFRSQTKYKKYQYPKTNSFTFPNIQILLVFNFWDLIIIMLEILLCSLVVNNYSCLKLHLKLTFVNYIIIYFNFLLLLTI